jgi:exonuclease III
MINFGCWNIRGLNATGKQREVKHFISSNFISLCAIIETHVHDVAISSICTSTFGRFHWVSNVGVSDHGARIILAWDSNLMDVMVLEWHAQFLHCQILLRDGSLSFFLTIVYGANQGVDRRLLWSGLRKFRAINGPKPWVLMGDFNVMLFPHDALGGVSKRNSEMTEFFDCISDIDVFDIRYSGIQHTWCQKPREEAGIRRKLDRVLANTEFTDLCIDVSASFLPRGISDHSPAIG